MKNEVFNVSIISGIKRISTERATQLPDFKSPIALLPDDELMVMFLQEEGKYEIKLILRDGKTIWAAKGWD